MKAAKRSGGRGRRDKRPRHYFTLLLFAGAAASAAWVFGQSAQQNPIQIENAKPGTTAWQLNDAADGHAIEGYASATSVNRGGQITFFVSTTDPSYTLQIFRLGWYGGKGGRAMTQPIDLPGVQQLIPSPDPTFNMVECNWNPSYTITTSNPSDPSDWVSGIYVAKLTGDSSGLQSYIIFVVRNDDRSSDLLFQQAVNTYQAYNAWGGTSLYSSNPRAFKVSFNRPYDDGWGTGLFLSYDFDNMAYLEQQGYDVTYSTDVDTHEHPSHLLIHKGFLIIGHDEYWSYEMRQNITAGRDAGVNLGFFAANECYWQIRFEPSPITGVADRTIVAYKEFADQDPDASNPATYYLITTQWRLPHGTLPGDPEDSLIGEMYNQAEPAKGDIVITNASSWVFANTGLSNGSHIKGVLGYEVNSEQGGQPPATVRLAHSPYTLGGTTFFGDMSVYQAASGATVFAAGTIQWGWGLSNISSWGPTSSLVDPAEQQIMNNVLDEFISSGPTPTPSGTPTPTSTPTPTPTPIPTPTPTPTITVTPTPTPAPTPTPVPSQITLRAVGIGSTSAASSQVTLATPPGVQPGDVMIAQVAVRGGVAAAAPSGWTLALSNADSAGNIAQAVYFRVASAAEPSSFTFTFPAGNDAAGGIAAYAGVNQSAPIDVKAALANNAAATTIAAPSVTIPGGHNNDRLLALFAIPASNSMTLPANVAPEWNFHAIGWGISVAMGDAPLAASGATGNLVATQTGSFVSLGAQLALLPAAGQ